MKIIPYTPITNDEIIALRVWLYHACVLLACREAFRQAGKEGK